ncbi:MAG: hypothetical protein ACYCO9_18365 [Streptosporangiaceae bacterium]
MLVVFGAAVIGVLAEAFVPRPARRGAHLVLTLGALAAAFALTVVVAASPVFAQGRAGRITAMGASGSIGPHAVHREPGNTDGGNRPRRGVPR